MRGAWVAAVMLGGCATGIGPTVGYGKRHGWFAGADASGGPYFAQLAGNLVDTRDGFTWTVRGDLVFRGNCHGGEDTLDGWSRWGFGLAEDRDGAGGLVEGGAEAMSSVKHGPAGTLYLGFRYAREWEVVLTAHVGDEPSDDDCSFGGGDKFH